MTRFVRTASALGVLVLVAATAAPWPATGGSQGTSFYVNCAFSPANGLLRVYIRDEEGLVRRRGERIRVLEPTGHRPSQPQWDRIDCGGSPTVSNTDRIRMRIESEGSTTGRLSLRGGPFEPGLTSETGVPEIEIVTLAREDDQELRIEGTPGNEHFRAGVLDDAEWVNLNPDAESTNPDGDLRLPGSWRPPVTFAMGDGDDTVTLNGGPEFDRSLRVRTVALTLGEGADHYTGRHPRAFLFGGTGADTIETGRRSDFVFDSHGRDSINTREGRDGLFAGGGKDRVWSGKGNDLVFTKDGGRDRVNCGPGWDEASLDARDRARSCEKEVDFSKSKLGSRFKRP